MKRVVENMRLISIVIPCYNEGEVLTIFYDEILRVAEKFNGQADFEFVFVDDGSKDSTLSQLKELSKVDSRVKYLSFSRNFGKEAAIYAGLSHASGDLVSIMDADLQDPPMLLVEMYNQIIHNGYDCVAARRVSRKGEPIIRSFFAKCFYSIINKISRTEIVDGARDYRLMTRKMVGSILSLGEYNRFSKGIFSWVGFKVKWLEYENIERAAGKTTWSFWKLFLYSLEGIAAFSTAPLAMAPVIGSVLFIISILLICTIIVKTLIWGGPVGGYSSLICAVMFIGGTQLLCIGVLGQYLAKTYLETKKRPIYVIREGNIDKNRECENNLSLDRTAQHSLYS